MKFTNLFSFLLHHRPTDDTLSKAKAIADAAERFISVIQALSGDGDAKSKALDAANAAVMHANVALANSLPPEK